MDLPMPYVIPNELRAALYRYVESHIPPGGFLTAVLENDLMEAVGRADHTNIQILKEICQYVHWEMPSTCHGSPEMVAAWLSHAPA